MGCLGPGSSKVGGAFQNFGPTGAARAFCAASMMASIYSEFRIRSIISAFAIARNRRAMLNNEPLGFLGTDFQIGIDRALAGADDRSECPRYLPEMRQAILT